MSTSIHIYCRFLFVVIVVIVVVAVVVTERLSQKHPEGLFGRTLRAKLVGRLVAAEPPSGPTLRRVRANPHLTGPAVRRVDKSDIFIKRPFDDFVGVGVGVGVDTGRSCSYIFGRFSKLYI